MVAPLGTGIAQTDEEFVGLQDGDGQEKRASVCHNQAGHATGFDRTVRAISKCEWD